MGSYFAGLRAACHPFRDHGDGAVTKFEKGLSFDFMLATNSIEFRGFEPYFSRKPIKREDICDMPFKLRKACESLRPFLIR